MLLFFRRFSKHHVFYSAWLTFLLLHYRSVDQNSANNSADQKLIVKQITSKKNEKSENVKKILLWNPWYGNFGFEAEESAFSRAGCSVANCFMSSDKKIIRPEEADAVVFLYTNLCELPKIYSRKPHQRFVLLTDDPPICYPRNYFQRDKLFGSFFNWTISYRENADITWRRGWVRPLKNRPKISKIHSNEKHRSKKKLMAWYVARCGSKSKREGYIAELQEYLQVDVYGPCGKMACPETNGTQGEILQNCLDYIAKNYKFALVFERFICDDFITKRFFDFLRRDIVPVVFGGADYDRIAPPHSFINALSMTPKQLANLLQTLNEDDHLYEKFLWWKDFYRVFSKYEDISQRPFCDLCEKLNNHEEPLKIYRDIDAWWYNSSKCNTPEDHGIQIKDAKVEDLHNIQIPWSLDD